MADLYDVWVNHPHSDKSGWSRDARGLPRAEAEEFAARQTTRTRIMPAAPPDPDEGDYLPKPPDKLVPGDRIYIRPTGWLTVRESFAAGNYHSNVGWQVHAEGPLGETVLSFTIHSLSSAPK